MSKYFLSNKAVDDLSKIWDYTMKFGQKIKPTNIIMNYLKIAKNYPKIKV